MDSFRYYMTHDHGFQTRTRPGGLIGNQTEIRFFKHREQDLGLIPTPIQACLLNKKTNQKMCLLGLKPTHGQR